jgi:tetratricopeptide (TPR) repeat protein
VTSCMRTVGTALAGAVFLMSCGDKGRAVAQGVGDVVVIRHEATVRNGTEIVGTLPPGATAEVQDSNADSLWVDYLSGGWVQRGDVFSPDEAISHYTKAIRQNPKDSTAYAGRANARRAKGQTELAIADYDHAIRIDATVACYYIGRGLAHSQSLDMPEKAIADYAEAIRLNPKCAEAYNNRGSVLSDMLRLDEAIRDLNEAIRLERRYAEAYHNRAGAWEEKGEHDKALADYGEAIHLNPKLAKSYGRRGRLWRIKDEDGRALADLNEAIRLHPKLTLLHLNRASIWASRGEYHRAISDCDTALRIDPHDVVARLDRAAFRALAGQYADAIADYSKLIQQKSASSNIVSWAYAGRGRAFGDSGAYDKAMNDLQEAIRLSPEDFVAYDGMAWLQATCPQPAWRDGQKAMENAQRACELSGWTVSRPLETLAAAYAETGDFSEAVKWQTKAIDLLKKESKKKAPRLRLEKYKEKKPYRDEKKLERGRS